MKEPPATVAVICPNLTCRAEQLVARVSYGRYSNATDVYYQEVTCKKCGGTFIAAFPDRPSEMKP